MHQLPAMINVVCKMPTMAVLAVMADVPATPVADEMNLCVVVLSIQVLVIVYVLNPDSVAV